MSDAATRIQKAINDNAVMVFTKFSDRRSNEEVEDKLRSLRARYITDTVNSAAEKAALAEISGQDSLPNIYINKEHIGGCSDLDDLTDLKERLKAAGAT